MTIITNLADGTTEIFESSNYRLSKPKDFHPMILKVTIYSGNKKIKTVSRPFKFFYKHFTFKTEKVQKIIAELNEQNRLARENKE